MPARSAYQGAERIRTAVQRFCIFDSGFNLDSELCSRFAGFADGEAHFAISRLDRKSRGRGIYIRPITVCYSCSFIIKVRADDRAVLERFARELGIGGRFYSSRSKPTPGRKNKPAVIWAVTRQEDCAALVGIFEHHPLWSKKARDFEIWARAVHYWCGPRSDGWEPMARWFDEIRAVRAFA